ncbi:hypothetical protein GTO91_02970 [Heliobacterium undosum]|uniref:Uncharacterized protein n=1 Tax=Heliomicrobium undosum TaxID=121734 RepID=A0A845L701_9FIRM|nr:hypothetical protein [Heliomicrobium undosum]MZP28681.1 hypothetical protein [Heliomicrobium undosum]
MFGLSEAMLSFFRRQIGLRTDANNAAGSLHAKVGDLKANNTSEHTAIASALARTPWAAGKKVYIASGFNATTYPSQNDVEVFNITGPLHVLGGYIEFMSGASNLSYKLEVDGSFIMNGVYGSTLNHPSTGVWIWRPSTGDYFGTSHKSLAFFLPDTYTQSFYSPNSTYTYTSFSGTAIFTFPPLFYSESRIRLTFSNTSSSYQSPSLKWGIFYTRV